MCVGFSTPILILQKNVNLSPPGIIYSPLLVEGPIFSLTIPSISINKEGFSASLNGQFSFQPAIDIEIDISGFELKKFKFAVIGDINQGLTLPFTIGYVEDVQ